MVRTGGKMRIGHMIMMTFSALAVSAAFDGISSLSASLGDFVCGLDTGGTLYCWGNVGGSDLHAKPTVFGTGIASVSVGSSHTCVVTKTTPGVRCWGTGSSGQLGTGDTSSASSLPTTSINLGGTAASVSSGETHTCAVTTTGALKCWGDGKDGRTGYNTENDYNAPLTTAVNVGSGLSAKEVAAGREHTCVLLTNGGVKCFGKSSNGRLGFSNGGNDQRSPPSSTLSLGASASQIASGDSHSCALLTTGVVKCWGRSDQGQVGSGSWSDQYSAQTVTFPNNAKATSIALGAYHSCALLEDATVRCWGKGNLGQLGDAGTSNRNSPGPAFDLAGVDAIAVAAGSDFTCIAVVTGGVRCFGASNKAVLGTGESDAPNAPERPVVIPKVTKVVGGKDFILALLSDGTVRGWGENGRGQLGVGDTNDRDVPESSSLSLGGTVTDIAAGREHACAIVSGGIKCWGRADRNQLGTGSTSQRDTPSSFIDIGSRTAVQLSAGKEHTCARFSDGTVSCWGEGDTGALGRGSSSDESTPPGSISLGSGLTAKEISCGEDHTCVVLSNGQVSCWGTPDDGRLGRFSSNTIYSPISVTLNGEGTTAVSITSGDAHTCVVTGTGGMQCWGLGSSGQLGDGSTNSNYGPGEETTFGSLTVKRLVAGSSHTCAILSDDSMRCWGLGSSGQLGQDSTSSTSSPPSTSIEFPDGSKTVKSIGAGDSHTCAVTMGGSVYCFGSDWSGQMGLKSIDGDKPVAFKFDVAAAANVFAGSSISCSPSCTLTSPDYLNAPGSSLTSIRLSLQMLTPDASDDTVVDIISVSVGGIPCFRTARTESTWPLGAESDSYLTGIECRDLVLDSSHFPTTSSQITLSSAVITYRFLKNSLRITETAYPVAVTASLTQTYTIEAEAFSMTINAPSDLGTLLNPRIVSTTVSSVAVADATAVGFVFEDFWSPDDDEPVLRVVGGGDGLDLEYFAVGGGSMDAMNAVVVQNLSASVVPCLAGLRENGQVVVYGETTRGAMKTAETSLQVAVPELQMVETPGLLDAEGGTLVVFKGVNFPSSNFTEPGHFVRDVCESTWTASNRSVVTSSSFVDELNPSLGPENVVFWAFVGHRPCIDAWVIDSTSIACIAPVGLPATNGSDVPVVLVLDGFVMELYETNLHYGPIASVTGSSLTGVSQTPSSVMLTVSSPMLEDVYFETGLAIGYVNVGPIRVASASVSILSSSSVEFAVPSGIGSGLAVVLCLEDVAGETMLVGQALASIYGSKWSSGDGSEGCTGSSGGPTVSYVLPAIQRVTPSQDLDPLGGQEIKIEGSNFGSPTVLAQYPELEPKVMLGSLLCLSLRHVSSTELTCITPTLSGSVLDTSYSAGGATSESILISVLTVSLFAVTPRVVLPAAPSRHDIDFVINVLGAHRVSRVLIGGQLCAKPLVVGEQQLLCTGIEAPTRWPDDGDVVVFVKDRNDTTNSTRSVLQPRPPPLVIAIDTSSGGTPTSGGSTISIVGEGFGIVRGDVEAIVFGWNHTALDLVQQGRAVQVTSHPYVSSSTAVVYLSNAPQLTWVSSAQMRVRLPPGVGVDIPIYVATTTGLVSPRFNISYQAPSLASMTPNILLPGVRDKEVTVCGSNLAPVADEVDWLRIGGVDCPREFIQVSTPFSCITCSALPTPLSNESEHDEWPASGEVQVSIRGQATAPVLGLGTFVPSPLASETNPAVAIVGSTVRLLGTGMGTSASYIVAVLVGGDEEGARDALEDEEMYASDVATQTETVVIRTFDYISATQISFKMPPAAGTNLAVRFATATSLISESNARVSVSPAEILKIVPSLLLPGVASETVTIIGTNFPTRQGDLDSIFVGGRACGEARVVNSTALLCRNLRTPMTPSETWQTSAIRVTIAGQPSSDTVLPGVSFINPPSVRGIAPPQAGPGIPITISGTNFGASAKDVQTVTVDGVACEPWAWQSPAEISCTIPSSHPTWALATDSKITPTVSAQVVLVTGLGSEPGVSAATFEPVGIRVRPNPWQRPRGVSAWRPLGQTGVLEIRWRYPGSLLEDWFNSNSSSIRITSFEVAASTNSTFPENRFSVSTTSTRAASRTQPASGSVLPSDPDAWEWFGAQLPLFTSAPVYVRVRATNSDGPGPWTYLTDAWYDPLGAMTPSTCTQDQYLATQYADTAPEKVVCLPCPEGATCAGLAAENVTAKQGFWRVPWSQYGLGFAECLVAVACIGSDEALQLSATASSLSNAYASDLVAFQSGNVTSLASVAVLEYMWSEVDDDDRPVALPGRGLQPAMIEECADGFRGVLCSACAVNYFPGAGKVCTPCGNQAWIGGRFFLLLIAVLVVFSLVLLRAWSTRALQSSKEVQVAKILVGHLQSIAIVGSASLRWPAGARDFFTIADTASSFTTSGLAIECLLGERATSPYVRTAVILTMPIWLILFAAFLWWLVGRNEDSLPRLKRFLSPPPTKPHSKKSSKESSSSSSSKKEDDMDLELISTGPSKAEPLPVELKAVPAPLTPEQKRKVFQTEEHQVLWQERMLVSCIIIAFLVHTPLSTAAFRLLTCQPISPANDPDATQLRLSMDLNIRCDDPDEMGAMLGLGIPMVVLISLGIPVFSALLLRSIGIEELAKPKWRNRLGFLLNGYRNEVFAWESVILLRKVLLALVTTTLAPSGGGMQITSALIVLLFALVLHARFHPYVSGMINTLESFSLITAAMTLVGGVYVVLDHSGAVEASDGSVSILASVIIAGMNSIFLLVAIALLSRRARGTVQRCYRRSVRYFGLEEALGDGENSLRRRFTARLTTGASSARLRSIVQQAASLRRVDVTSPPAATNKAVFAHQNPLARGRPQN